MSVVFFFFGEGEDGTDVRVFSFDFSILFELIKGEMDYVKDLENIEVVSLHSRPLTLSKHHQLILAYPKLDVRRPSPRNGPTHHLPGPSPAIHPRRLPQFRRAPCTSSETLE